MGIMKKDDTPGLFSAFADRPLADRLRPSALEDIMGQDHLLGEGGPLRLMADSGKMTSFILWGPPGCGKTTLARILATRTSMHFAALSAVFSGMADLRKAFERNLHAFETTDHHRHGGPDGRIPRSFPCRTRGGFVPEASG